jgi:hypothetical protein
MKNYSLCLFLVFSLFVPFSCLNGFIVARTTKPTKVVSVETEHPEVRELLLLIPESERAEFVKIAKQFGVERNMDWRFLLLSFYQESGLRTTSVSGVFMGLTMFGPDARRVLGVTTEQLLQMNHVQQLQLALRMWAITEQRSGRMHEFIDLLIINFAPAWYKHHGNPYPATQSIKAANSANVDANGNITKQSILSFFRRKVQRDPKLVYFIGKI